MKSVLHQRVPLAYGELICRFSFDIKGSWMTVLSRLYLRVGLSSFCTLYSQMVSMTALTITGLLLIVTRTAQIVSLSSRCSHILKNKYSGF